MTTSVFTTPGSNDFTVPAAVNKITIKIWGGGAGGGAGGTVSIGGNGAGAGYVQGDIDVVPGQELKVHVGGLGGLGDFVSTSGGGGGGAGASHVFREDDKSLQLMAGGGGGGGGGDNSSATQGGNGGPGGDNTGGSGSGSGTAGGGGGGTQTTGGAGGTGGGNTGQKGGDKVVHAADFGNCLDFDGTDEFCASTNSYSNPQTFTTELWFKSTTTNGGLLMGWSTSRIGSSPANYGRRLWMLDDGKIAGGIWDGGPLVSTEIISSSSYNDGNWHHAALLHSSIGFELVVDGVSQGTDPATSGNTGTGWWRIAGTGIWTFWTSAPTDNYFVGQIDEVRYWQERRSICQLKANMHQYLTGSETNLAFYWKLNESTGTVANDETSNNNDGDLQNMENADWVSSSWSPPDIITEFGIGGNGADGETGSGEKGSEDNEGVTCAGGGGLGNVDAGFAGGGGAGAGFAGGGGGSGSASGNAGGGGGGGGSNFIIGSATSTTNSQGSGVNPPNTGDPDYAGSAGVGGTGGATSTDGNNGNNGRVVLIYTPVFGGDDGVSNGIGRGVLNGVM